MRFGWCYPLWHPPIRLKCMYVFCMHSYRKSSFNFNVYWGDICLCFVDFFVLTYDVAIYSPSLYYSSLIRLYACTQCPISVCTSLHQELVLIDNGVMAVDVVKVLQTSIQWKTQSDFSGFLMNAYLTVLLGNGPPLFRCFQWYLVTDLPKPNITTKARKQFLMRARRCSAIYCGPWVCVISFPGLADNPFCRTSELW